MRYPSNISGIKTRNTPQLIPKIPNPKRTALRFNDDVLAAWPTTTQSIPIWMPIRSVHIKVKYGLVWYPDWMAPEKYAAYLPRRKKIEKTLTVNSFW
jgi:hypothetical protein